MTEVIEISDEIARAEQKFNASAEQLAAALESHKRAEEKIEQVKRAIRVANDEVGSAAENIAREMESMEAGLLTTGKIDSGAVRRIAQLRSAHSLMLDISVELSHIRMPEAQIAMKESDVAVFDALADRYQLKAQLQRLRRDELLADAVELEGVVKVDDGSGKSAEYDRLAAENRIAAQHQRADLVPMKENLEQRKLQLRLNGRK